MDAKDRHVLAAALSADADTLLTARWIIDDYQGTASLHQARPHDIQTTPGGTLHITEIGWAGTRTAAAEELATFYEYVLRLPLVHKEPGFWVFELSNGRHVEVFAEWFPGKEHFSTGPVVGFAVEDLAVAVDELRAAGVELLGQPGATWQHFRGPDGNVYELVQS